MVYFFSSIIISCLIYIVPNLYEYLSSAENKIRYFEECFNFFVYTMNVSVLQKNHWTPLTFIIVCTKKKLSFCALQKKENHTSLELHEDK